MSTIDMVALGLLFLAVFACAVLALRLFSRNPMQARLKAQAAPSASTPSAWVARAVKLSNPLARLSSSENEWERSQIRTRFMHAGIRHRSAPALFFATKTMLAVGSPLAIFFILLASGTPYSTNELLTWLLATAAAGYYLPNLVLNRLIERRERDIFENFPDVLDLLTVCVEAGLAIDAALNRVAIEIELKSKVLSDELMLVTLELGAGSNKEKALRNFALRTGVTEIESLVAMLIQAERFGTSIAASLRVQSEQLRTKRRQRAEEQAAKIALKLMLPLILFIFPSLLVVLMGPAFIQIYRVLLPSLGGSN